MKDFFLLNKEGKRCSHKQLLKPKAMKKCLFIGKSDMLPEIARKQFIDAGISVVRCRTFSELEAKIWEKEKPDFAIVFEEIPEVHLSDNNRNVPSIMNFLTIIMIPHMHFDLLKTAREHEGLMRTEFARQ